MTNKQYVSDCIFSLLVSSCLIPWPTARECQTLHFTFPGSLLMSCPMIKRGWVTGQVTWTLYFSTEVSLSSLILTNRMWVTDTTCFSMQSHVVTSHDQQQVSDTAFVFLCNRVITWPPTASEWLFSCLAKSLCPSHDQQQASDTTSLSVSSSHPMTNREWVAFLYLAKLSCLSHDQKFVSANNTFLNSLQAVSSCLIPWSKGSECHCFFLFQIVSHVSSCDQKPVSAPAFYFFRYSHHVSSHDQKGVSATASLFSDSLIMSHPVANSGWVTLHIFLVKWSCLIPWAIGSECLFLWWPSHSHHTYPTVTNRLQVSITLLSSNLISHLIPNSQLVAFICPHETVLIQTSHPTGSEWNYWISIRKSNPFIISWSTGSVWFPFTIECPTTFHHTMTDRK